MATEDKKTKTEEIAERKIREENMNFADNAKPIKKADSRSKQSASSQKTQPPKHEHNAKKDRSKQAAYLAIIVLSTAMMLAALPFAAPVLAALKLSLLALTVIAATVVSVISIGLLAWKNRVWIKNKVLDLLDKPTEDEKLNPSRRYRRYAKNALLLLGLGVAVACALTVAFIAEEAAAVTTAIALGVVGIVLAAASLLFTPVYRLWKRFRKRGKITAITESNATNTDGIGEDSGSMIAPDLSTEAEVTRKLAAAAHPNSANEEIARLHDESEEELNEPESDLDSDDEFLTASESSDAEDDELSNGYFTADEGETETSVHGDHEQDVPLTSSDEEDGEGEGRGFKH